jgi:hypothetical protein
MKRMWVIHLLQVVQSRTCGSAAEQGGIGIRMLVPLVDMLNHGGDEKGGTSHGHIASDSVRWAPCSRVSASTSMFCSNPELCHCTVSLLPDPSSWMHSM